MSEIRRRLEGLPSRVMKHLSTSSHCVVGPLVTTKPEKCFPVVFTFPSVEVMLLSLEEIALNCLYVGVKKTSGKTIGRICYLDKGVKSRPSNPRVVKFSEL